MIKTVLIVDDDAVTLKLLKELLISAGYKVVQAQTGRQAIDRAIAYSVDAVIMDIMLPDMDGPEAIAVLKGQEKFKNTRVIFLSGIVSRQEGCVDEILVAGHEYPAISKPIDFECLLQLLDED